MWTAVGGKKKSYPNSCKHTLLLQRFSDEGFELAHLPHVVIHSWPRRVCNAYEWMDRRTRFEKHSKKKSSIFFLSDRSLPSPQPINLAPFPACYYCQERASVCAVESEGRERWDASKADEDHHQQRKGQQKERDGNPGRKKQKRTREFGAAIIH
jgi:hypothetical protein